MLTWKLLQQFYDTESEFAVLILNQPILCEPELVKSFWNKAAVRALADGGANRWLDFLQKNTPDDFKLPDFISGDFDSLKPSTRTYFEDLNVELIYTPDQDETDFTKALRSVDDILKARNLNIKFVFAICENSGRFDQIIGNINTLHLAGQILEDISVVLLSSDCVTWLLRPGKHTICVTGDFVKETYPCGLIPLCGSTLVTTSGLKWNVENHTMEVGGLISTSNTYSEAEVNVSCNRPLIWTTQYCKTSR